MADLPQRKLESQARACAEAVAAILWETLGGGRPADRALAAYLRERRQFGARDRRLLRASVFAVLRWWGWLRALAPKAFIEAVETQTAEGADAAPEEWSALLLAAHALGGDPLPPPATVWARAAGLGLETLPAPAAVGEVEIQARALLQVLGLPAPHRIALADLVPAWVPAETASPRPFAELVQWLQRRPPIWLRAQTDRVEALIRDLAESGVDVSRHPRLPRALRLAPDGVNLREVRA